MQNMLQLLILVFFFLVFKFGRSTLDSTNFYSLVAAAVDACIIVNLLHLNPLSLRVALGCPCLPFFSCMFFFSFAVCWYFFAARLTDLLAGWLG